jgi:SecD/SecF fusion protein
MLFAAASYLNITLSLASIAGIILTLGMAVDANVLIFERMKEEQKKGLTLKEAVQKGYSKAFSAILDSNLTTMIAAFVLLSFDSGPIRGFSLTLLIGLITSVLTALFMTKFFYFIWIEKTKHTALYFSNWFRFNSINFLSKTKVATMVTIMILLTGIISLSLNSSSIIGMDFKGGYALDLKFTQEPQNISLKTTLNKALEAKGLKSSQLHIRELETPTHVRLFLDKEVSLLKKDQISWSQFFTTTLKNSDLVIEPDCLKLLDQKMTTISGQLSESMATQAIIGLSMALGLIFIYVLVRFKWPYALAATISLIHDVILTLSFVSILALLGVPVSLDISSIAAILTIIGYSLNDTIIVFDRIREERSLNTDSPLTDIIRKSLNATLSRTILTSGTTLIVLIPMIFMGSGTLFNFSLVMTLGVIFGTLSTLFLACPLFLYFSQKQKSKSMRAN